MQPPQHQDRQPGLEREMRPPPEVVKDDYRPAGKLEGKVAIVTGGDSGIGRAVAVHFALEGADVAIAYLDEHEDARATQQMIEKIGRRCLVLAGDIGDELFCRKIVDETVQKLGRLDIVVNNAGEQHEADTIEKITAEQLERTFRTNVFGAFHLTKHAMPHLGEGAVIINTASVTAYRGNPTLLDYSATKGALVAFTRSLARALADKKIRVNAVAPGPIWTPLIPASFSDEHVQKFGENTALGRAGQPSEVAPCYVFLASTDSSYITGQVIHPNGGDIVNT